MEDKYLNGRGLEEYTAKLKDKMAFINPTGSSPYATLFNFIHPVGTVIDITNVNFNPNQKWYGTWQEITDYECVAYFKSNGTTLVNSKGVSSLTKDGYNYVVQLSMDLPNKNGIINATAEVNNVGMEIIGAYWNTNNKFTLDVGDHTGTMHSDVLNWYVEVWARPTNPTHRVWKRTA